MTETATERASRTPARTGRKRRSPGWVPQQHGAWAMLIAPYVLGLWLTIRDGRLEAADLLLFVVWMLGYFAFNAVSLWLKSRMKKRYLPPVQAYAAATAVLGLALLVLQPRLAEWVVMFGPLSAIGLWCAWRRDDRSILSGAVTVAAACLIPAVVYSNGVLDFIDQLGDDASYDAIALICLVSLGYFFGTVLYVKTMLRERGHVGYVVASVVWHLGCAVACAVLGGAIGWWLAAFFLVMTVRALLMPVLGPMRGHIVSAKSLGIGEIGSTLALVAIVMSVL